MNNKFTEG